MKTGAIRSLIWESPDTTRGFADLSGQFGLARTEFAVPKILEFGQAAPTSLVPLGSAIEEARLLLRIAAEVEGALMVQYLYSAFSLVRGVVVNSGTGDQIQSDGWFDTIRSIAKQEMGHLITVQNLMLSLDAPPHLDRENFPIDSPLYPFRFELERLEENTLAKAVAAEAPKDVRPKDRADYEAALSSANAAIGGTVSRVGQIYERLYFLFQDSDAPQKPWDGLQNPFPSWPAWHVDPAQVGFNQDRQAKPGDWHGSNASGNPDSAIYVLTVSDKASAREAIFKISMQGEGPIEGQVEGETHFDKFLRIYREFKLYKAVADAPVMTLNQAPNPTTVPNKNSTIKAPGTLSWAKLANCRYEMLLLQIALALSIGSPGSVPGTTATAQDFNNWAFQEMVVSLRSLGQQLRTMPLTPKAAEPLAGLPFDLPTDRDLPVTVPEQLGRLRTLVADSQAVRATIQSSFSPTNAQKALLTVFDNADRAISAKIAAPAGS